jgi:hypothetical protein
MPALPVMVRPGLMGLPALRSHAMVAWVAPAELVALAQTAALVEQAELAVVVLVRPAALVWLQRVVLAVSVATVALGSMRAASTTVRQVVMADRVALVDRAVRLARLARMRPLLLAVLAGPAVTRARREMAATGRLETQSHPMAELGAMEGMWELRGSAALEGMERSRARTEPMAWQ